MTEFVRACPACGADRVLGERLCPACGASWRGMPADEQKGTQETRRPPLDTGVLLDRDSRPPQEPWRARAPGDAAWIWLKALAWVAAGWLGMAALVHLVHLLHGL